MKSYSVENIKAFRKRTDVEIKPITVFVGKNSCGKSSLLRFPVVLAQTFATDSTSPLLLYGKMIDYGNYEDVVFGHAKDSISFSLRYNMNFAKSSFSLLFLDKKNEKPQDFRPVDIVVRLGKTRKKVVVEEEELYISGKKCYGVYRESNSNYSFKVFCSYDQKERTFVDEELQFVSEHWGVGGFIIHHEDETLAAQVLASFPSDRASKLEKEIGECVGSQYWYRFPEILLKNEKISCKEDMKELVRVCSVFSFYNDLMDSIMRTCRYEFSRLSYIGPFRQNPERVYRDQQFRTDKVGVKGENVSTVLFRDSQKKNSLIGRISNWLQETMGYKLLVEEISNGLFNILLEDGNGIKSNIIDVGFGISQILPIVAQILVDSEKKSSYYIDTDSSDDLIIVEQPELHLHPAAQSELATLFVEGALNGKKKMLIETHSEHFIRKLQVLVADDSCRLTNEDVAIYYVEKSEDGGAFVNEMKILPNGKFEKKWPTGFFDKAHELTMELLEKTAR